MTPESLIDRQEVAARLREAGYCIVANDTTRQIAERARAAYFAGFGEVPLRSGGFGYSELQAGPIRKKNISSSNGVGEAYAQVLQSTYYPRNPGEPAIAQAFGLIVAVRNFITGRPAGFGEDPRDAGFWNARRIHHYPCGGGFMVRHTDTHFCALLGEHGYLQVIYLLSQRGTDFSTGGGMIWDLAGNPIDLEMAGGFGALVIFDGRIRHAVTDIDPTAAFSFEARTGRLSAIADLYEYRG
jgi:hypothetical protein